MRSHHKKRKKDDSWTSAPEPLQSKKASSIFQSDASLSVSQQKSDLHLSHLETTQADLKLQLKQARTHGFSFDQISIYPSSDSAHAPSPSHIQRQGSPQPYVMQRSPDPTSDSTTSPSNDHADSSGSSSDSSKSSSESDVGLGTSADVSHSTSDLASHDNATDLPSGDTHATESAAIDTTTTHATESSPTEGWDKAPDPPIDETYAHLRPARPSAPKTQAPKPPPIDLAAVNLIKFLLQPDVMTIGNQDHPLWVGTEPVANILLSMQGNLGVLKEKFKVHQITEKKELAPSQDANDAQPTEVEHGSTTVVELEDAIATFLSEGHFAPSRIYLLNILQGKHYSLVSRLLVASGLVYRVGTDPEEMVTLVENASAQDRLDFASSPIKDKVLNRLSILGATTSRKEYVNKLLRGEEVLADINQLDAHSGDAAFSDSFSTLRDSLMTKLKELKVQEFQFLLQILQGVVQIFRRSKKLTNPESAKRIMNWAQRQSPEIRDYLSGDNDENPINVYLKGLNLFEARHRKYILSLLNLDSYNALEPTADAETREQFLNDLRAEELVTYLTVKKQKFSGWILQEKYVTSLLEKLTSLGPKGRDIFLRRFSQTEHCDPSLTEDPLITQGDAVESVLSALQTYLKGKGATGSGLRRIIALFEVGASEFTRFKGSVYNQLVDLTEQNLERETMGKRAIRLLSKAKSDEYLQILRDRELLMHLYIWTTHSDWEHIENILGIDASDIALAASSRELYTLNDKITSQELNTEQASEYAANLTELRPLHWSAKLTRELEKTLWDRNKVFSLVTRVVYAGRRLMAIRDAEANSDVTVPSAIEGEAAKYSTVKQFTMAVYNGLSQDAQLTFFRGSGLETRLEPALDALANGRMITAAERIEGATFRDLSPKRLRGRGMRVKSLLNSIREAKGAELIQWTNIADLKERISQFNTAQTQAQHADSGGDPASGTDSNSSSTQKEVEALESQIRTFTFDLKPEFKTKIQAELPRIEFEEFYAEILNKLADASEHDTAFTSAIAQTVGQANVLRMVPSGEVAAELLRSKALMHVEDLNNSGWQLDDFSSKGSQRREAIATLDGQLRSANDKLTQGHNISLDELKVARQRAQRGNERFVLMRERVKEATMIGLGLVLAIAATLATGGLAGAGLVTGGLAALAVEGAAALEGMLVPMGLSIARAAILQAVEAGFEGNGFNRADALFVIVRDAVLAATTVESGELSNYIEASNTPTLAKEMAKNGKAAETFGKFVGNVSPIEVTLRTVASSAMYAMTSAEQKEWFKGKEALLAETLIMGFKDGLSKTLNGLIDLQIGFQESQKAKGATPDITQLSEEQIALWCFNEVFTGQNYAVCEMDSFQDWHLNFVAGQLDELVEKRIHKATGRQEVMQGQTPQLGRRVRLRRQGIGLLRDVNFQARGVLGLGFTPVELLAVGYSTAEIEQGAKQMLAEGRVKDLTTFTTQLKEANVELELDVEDEVSEAQNRRSSTSVSHSSSALEMATTTTNPPSQ